MIELLSARTPNGFKVSIALEELEIPYEVNTISLRDNMQKEQWFLKLNPNGRIPVIIDHDENNHVVFESGAILQYLAEKTGKLMPKDKRNRSIMMQWLFFQMGGIGPMMGQANVFYRYFPEKIPAAIERYQNESRRLLEVLDSRLKEANWLAETYSIADIANWAWVRTYEWSGITLDGLDNLKRWNQEMSKRPACKRGVEIPEAIEKIDDKERVKRARRWVTK